MWASVVFVLLSGIPAWAEYSAYDEFTGDDEKSDFYIFNNNRSYGYDEDSTMMATGIDAVSRIKRSGDQDVIRSNPGQKLDARDALNKILYENQLAEVTIAKHKDYTDIYDYVVENSETRAHLGHMDDVFQKARNNVPGPRMANGQKWAAPEGQVGQKWIPAEEKWADALEEVRKAPAIIAQQWSLTRTKIKGLERTSWSKTTNSYDSFHILREDADSNKTATTTTTPHTDTDTNTPPPTPTPTLTLTTTNTNPNTNTNTNTNTPTPTTPTPTTTTANTNTNKSTNTKTTTTTTTNTNTTTTTNTNKNRTTTTNTNTSTTTNTTSDTNTTSTPTTTTAKTTTTNITTTPETNITTTPCRYKTWPNFDINKIINIIANLTDEYDWNLTEQFNKTLIVHGIPTCPRETTPTTTSTTPSPYDFGNSTVVGKCFVCGLKNLDIPKEAYCADAFAGDFLPLTPINPKARAHIASFRKYCRYLDVHNYVENPFEPRAIYGRFSGGCAVRWTDLSGIYTQRTCRARFRPLTGKHFGSKRMSKLEMSLVNEENACIISPMATLLPMSRGISLYARFYACVCTGSWCNGGVTLQLTLCTTLLSLCFAVLPSTILETVHAIHR